MSGYFVGRMKTKQGVKPPNGFTPPFNLFSLVTNTEKTLLINIYTLVLF